MKEFSLLMPLPMSLATPWTFKLLGKIFTRIVLLSSLSAALTGCALFSDNSGPEPSYAPREQVFSAPYDKVWRATQLALKDYRMSVNNMDQGVIETEPRRRPDLWTPPHRPNYQPGGVSSWLSIRVLRGQIEGRPAIKVSVRKNTEQASDFFSEPRPLPSDGLEEEALLYRIERELFLEQALERALSQP